MTRKITGWGNLFKYWSVQVLALIGAVNAGAVALQTTGMVQGETIGLVAGVSSVVLTVAAGYLRNKPQDDLP